MISLVAYDINLLLNGDVTGFIIDIYTGAMGQFFMGFVLMTMFGLIYIRTNSLLYASVIWILIGFSLEASIPTAGLSVAKLFLVFGVAAGLYSLFTRSRVG